MTPPISYASTRLGYPLYQLEFDPYSRGYLLVGGGGGGGNAGVPNKLNLVDVSSRAELTSVADLTLSPDEDSVSSLASLATKDGLTTFAGVSSSVKDRSAGKNEHFRSYGIKFPKKSRANAVETAAIFLPLSKATLLRPAAATGKYMNQKLLRLSPVVSRDKSTKRVGALSSCDGEASEIAVFDATSQAPTQASVFARLDLEGKDAQDLDLAQATEGSFSLAYCTEWSARVQDFTYDFARKSCKLGTAQPIELLAGIQPGVELRCIRWLSPKHVVVARNDRPAKHSELLVLAVDRAAQAGKVVLRQRLPHGTRNSNTLDVCLLDADMITGERQVLIAVAGSDGAIHVYVLDHVPAISDPEKSVRSLRLFSTLRDVHGGNGICKLAFEPFFPPQQPAGSTMSVASTPAYARLASVAVFSDAVTAESIALTSTPSAPRLTPEIDGAQKKVPAVRWVLSSASTERMFSWAGLLLLGFVMLVSAFLLQGYVNADERVLAPLRALNSHLSPLSSSPGAAVPLHDRPALRSRVSSVVTENAVPAPSSAPESIQSAVDHAEQAAATTAASLADLLAQHVAPSSADDDGADGANKGEPKHALLVRPHHDDDERVAISLHERGADEHLVRSARSFDELSADEQDRWKERLSKAGHWAAGEGESVLKSILFSEYAAVVGGALRDAVLG